MHGYDERGVYQSEVYSSRGKMHGRIYVTRTTVLRNDYSFDTKHTQLEKCFGDISVEERIQADKWCKKWMQLIRKYCTHKTQKFKTDEYGMSIDVSKHGYCYYSIVKFSEKDREIDLYPAVTAYLYKMVKKVFFRLYTIDIGLTSGCLRKCHQDAITEWNLITNK